MAPISIKGRPPPALPAVSACTLKPLNPDILPEICSYLTTADVLQLSRVNRACYNRTTFWPFKSSISLPPFIFSQSDQSLSALYNLLRKKQRLKEFVIDINSYAVKELADFTAKVVLKLPAKPTAKTSFVYYTEKNSHPEDLARYRRLIFAKFHIQRVYLTGAKPSLLIEICKQHPHLDFLMLEQCILPPLGKFLVYLKALRTLSLINNTHQQKLEKLPIYCPKLQELSLSKSQISRFPFSLPFNELRVLELSSPYRTNTSITNIDQIPWQTLFPQLASLNLTGQRTLTSLENIPPTITSLNITNTAISTAELARKLPFLPALEELIIFSCPNINSVTYLCQHPALKKLAVAKEHITNPQEFAELQEARPHLALDLR